MVAIILDAFLQSTMTNKIDLTFALRRVTTIVAVSILTVTLIAAISGTLLAFHYQPVAGSAYRSLEQISTELPFGWLIRGIHENAGNFAIALGLIQVVLMFASRQFSRSWLTAWIGGILFVLVAIALGWTAMIFDWTQEGFWRLSIELGTIEAIPFFGSLLREIMTGGNGISTLAVLRQYTMHSYVLPLAAIALAVIHLRGLILQDIGEKNKAKLESEEQSLIPQGES